MSELMNKNTYTFQGLASKYQQFRQPAYRIKVGGSDIGADLGLYADSVEIQQTIQKKSGQCRFSIKNAYDLKSRSFRKTVKSTFPLGQSIDVSLGYGTPVLLFRGYISDVSFSFTTGGAPSVMIVCHDIRALMLQGQYNAMPNVASFPEVMSILMSYYISLVKMHVVYYDIWNILEDFRQNSNDLDYIFSYAEKRGYEFFVLSDHCYFRKQKSNTKPIMTLEWGEGILSFDRNFTYSSSSLKGALCGLLSLLPFSTEQFLKPDYPSKAATKNINFQLDTSDARNALDLINIMASYTMNISDDMVGGSVSCVGLPEIVPGRYIKLKNLDADFLDKTYYIEEVTHTLNESGYTTAFNITSALGWPWV